ncbi:Mitochondrial ous recombination protein 1 [Candida viswanathii]|uniref:Large ribosomal subunit protein mL67 n=1 Tax=Candida viswanathii TaxID=5486 RepID=A0A367XQN8_9ASCO|nr:Mitochondrial ous recombination protein 1 [Candida viswanathii]
MTFRTPSEKRMRKFLIDHLKTRIQHGARVAQINRTPRAMIDHKLGPQVFVFRNLFSGQVLYSQFPAYHKKTILEQFVSPNWQNRLPSRRQDLWKIMCVMNFHNYNYATAAYRGLIDLKQTRDTVQKKVANKMRKKSEEGTIWYSGQYRPTYTQEAVADMTHVIDVFNLEGTTIYWANESLRGDDKYWRNDLVEHDKLPVHSPKQQSVLLDVMRQDSVKDFRKRMKMLKPKVA